MEHFMANSLDSQYQQLLQDIIDFGVDKQDRTTTGTKSIFGYTIHHNMSWGFPLLTTKKVPFKTMATELMWFLMGDTNIKYLVENGCHIWDGDAFANYYRNFEKYLNTLPEGSEVDFIINKDKFINKIKTDDEFAKKWGELGPIYGKQWRRWHTSWDVVEDKSKEAGVRRVEKGIDQIQNLINDLKTNPDSRRLMVSAWNVGELDQMVLPPCHYGFQVYTRELSAKERTGLGSKGSTRLYDMIKEGNYETIDADIEMHKVCDEAGVPKRAISLMWNQRSVDVFLGLPFNIASYGLLLEMIAHEVNMIPEHLIGNLGDTHLYSNHIEQAKEQISRESKDLLPTLKMSSGHNFRAALKGKADEIDLNDFILLGYDPHPTIKAPLSN
jgi:thymidylate synthase